MKENNIFEGAKFGDNFLTRNGKNAHYLVYNDIYNRHYLWVEGQYYYFNYFCDGKLDTLCKNNGDYDIVSRYQEPIDEDKLTKYVNDYISENHSIVSEDSEFQYAMNIAVAKAYNVAYRKAKEEK